MSDRKRQTVEAELAAARKNHAAAVELLELLELYPERHALVARAIASRDAFAAAVARLEREMGGLAQ